MLLDRHRVARLVELSELAQRLGPADRMLREEEVAVLIKAAYDDASDAARQAFMQETRSGSRTAWPWSAVTAGLGGPPPLLTLLRGQVLAADDDPGDRLPGRGQLGGRGFEALHQALERWDTATIRRHIGPQGWVAASSGTANAVPRMSSASATPTPTRNPNGGARPGGGAALRAKLRRAAARRPRRAARRRRTRPRPKAALRRTCPRPGREGRTCWPRLQVSGLSGS